MLRDWKTKMNRAPFLVNFSKYSSVGIVLYTLKKKERKHVSKQAQIFALFVQKLFFFLCGSGQVPIKVVFQASFPCSGAAAFFSSLFYWRAWRKQRDCRFEVNRTVKYALNCVYWVCFSWNRFLFNVHVEYVQLFFSINSGIKLQLILVQLIVGQLVRNVMDQKCRSA